MACTACGSGRAARRPSDLVWRRKICANSGSGRTLASGTSRAGRGVVRVGGAGGVRGSNTPCGNISTSARRPCCGRPGAAVRGRCPGSSRIWREVRVGLGRQARGVAVEPDLARRVQIHQPRLQVVRMRRQDGVRQQPAAHVAPAARARASCQAPPTSAGRADRAARQRGRGSEHGNPAEDAQKGGAAWLRLLWR